MLLPRCQKACAACGFLEPESILGTPARIWKIRVSFMCVCARACSWHWADGVKLSECFQAVIICGVNLSLSPMTYISCCGAGPLKTQKLTREIFMTGPLGPCRALHCFAVSCSELQACTRIWGAVSHTTFLLMGTLVVRCAFAESC